MLDNNGTLDSKHRSSIRTNIPEMLSMHDGNNRNLKAAWSTKHLGLDLIEEYIVKKSLDEGLTLDYDITAKEPLYFNTLNYTTFAGFLIIHPCNFEQSLRQMSDAFADNIEAGHVDHLKEKIKKDNTFSKYVFGEEKPAKAKEALVVLTGGNKLKKHCCVGKLEKIIEKHGRDNVLFKKHPVSYDEAYKELSEYLGGIHYADAYSNLFDLMKNSEYVYSTMKSESALIATILNKKLEHFDLLQNRNLTSFGHINYYIYSTKNTLDWVQKCFGSPKSGVFHPVVDKNWKEKVDKYFEYIQELRSFYKDAYLW